MCCSLRSLLLTSDDWKHKSQISTVTKLTSRCLIPARPDQIHWQQGGWSLQSLQSGLETVCMYESMQCFFFYHDLLLWERPLLDLCVTNGVRYKYNDWPKYYISIGNRQCNLQYCIEEVSWFLPFHTLTWHLSVWGEGDEQLRWERWREASCMSFITESLITVNIVCTQKISVHNLICCKYTHCHIWYDGTVR